MGRHDDQHSLQAWVTPEFASAVAAMAEAAGVSRSDLVRDSLNKRLLSLDHLAENLTYDDGDVVLEKSAELRHTLVPITAEEAGISEDELQQKVWDLNLKKDRSVRVGGSEAGYVTEAGVWPFGGFDAACVGGDGSLRKARMPGGTAFVGIRWTPEVWHDVQDGTLSANDLAKQALGVG